MTKHDWQQLKGELLLPLLVFGALLMALYIGNGCSCTLPHYLP